MSDIALPWTVVFLFGVLGSLLFVWLDTANPLVLGNAAVAVICAFGIGLRVAQK